MLSDLQKKTAQAIVNIFETGRVRGDYGSITLLAGDTGHLTYGRSQTTLASGNLYLLIEAYCEAPGAQFGADLNPYLERLKECDLTLDNDTGLRSALRSAGDDPVMWDVQDHFFDQIYWAPCVREADALGVESALGTAVVYDSHIHGSWKAMRDRTTSNHGSPATIGETTWIAGYVLERRNWLATNANTLLRKTVYRMDSFQQLIDIGKWDLSLPLTIRGVEINEEVLLQAAPVRASAHDATERMLRLATPRMHGDDVKEIQQALAHAGADIEVDGVFGPNTDAAVRDFQTNAGLKPNGIVGPATRAALGL